MVKSPNIFLLLLVFISSFGSVSFAEQATQNARPRMISTTEFYNSDAGYFIEKGNYPAALKSLEGLISQFPEDPLLLRYKAMVLDLNGDSTQSIELFENLLKSHPDHIPTHFFLGNAYSRAGNEEAAKKEWQWVAREGSDTFYADAAKASLEK